MSRPVLIVTPQSIMMLGLAQALLKFGYQILTAYPNEVELERAERIQPALVVLRPPGAVEERDRCLRLIKERFRARGVPVLACVSDAAEEAIVRKQVGPIPILVGSPLRLNELYARIQEIFDLARRAELRITTEIAVAHREPGLYAPDFYYYATITSLSPKGCFIKTDNPYPVDTKVELVFCIGSAARSVKVSGRVCRNGPGGTGGEGMGVAFGDVPEETLARLESFLMGHLGTLEVPATL